MLTMTPTNFGTLFQPTFGAASQPQSFSFAPSVFPQNTNSNGVFGNSTAPNNSQALFVVNPTTTTPTTSSPGANNATTPTSWSVFSPQQQQAPSPLLFTTQPLQLQQQQQQQQPSPPPIFVFSNPQQTPAQLPQPQQNVIQPVQPQQQPSPPSAPLFPQLIPNSHLYKSFLEEKMALLIEEYKKLESNQLFLGCPNSNPLVGGGIMSPQSFKPQLHLPCDIGRPSTLALDYVQGVNKKLEAETKEKDLAANFLWRNRYPLKTVPSTESSMPLHDANVKRSWGSTCLSDPYRDKHRLHCFCCSQHQHHQLPDIWSPRYPQLISSPLNDKNYLKQRTLSWRRGLAGYSYSEKDRTPQLNRFRVDGASFNNMDNLHLSQIRDKYVQSHTLKDDVDKKWKALDEKVVRDSNQNRRQLGQEWNTEKRVQLLQSPVNIFGTHFNSHLTDDIDSHDQEDSKRIWQWFKERRQRTGPPLKSHLDDDDFDFYEKLRRETNRIRPETKMVANLPKRGIPIVKSTKSTSRLLAPTTKRSEICKEEIRTLYQNLKKGGIVNGEAGRLPETSADSSVVELTNKTSPVFLTVWKNERLPTSSTSTANQTENPISHKQPYTLGSFAEESQNARRSNETREQCTRILRELDPYEGRLRGKGPRIGEQTRRTKDQISFSSSPKEVPIIRPVVKLSKAGYYCIPSIDSLNKLAVSKDWNCVWVKDFEIGHNVHGKAVFPGYTNVYGLNFDEIVEISHKAFELYPEPYKEPPFGKELNKPCTVTLYNIWPQDTEIIKFEDFLKRCCKKFKGNFLRYCPEHGEWVFEVQQLPSQSDAAGEQPVTLPHVDSNEDL